MKRATWVKNPHHEGSYLLDISGLGIALVKGTHIARPGEWILRCKIWSLDETGFGKVDEVSEETAKALVVEKIRGFLKASLELLPKAPKVSS